VIESQVVPQWTAQACLEGIKEDIKEGKATTLLRLLRREGRGVPPDLEQAILALGDPVRFDTLVEVAH